MENLSNCLIIWKMFIKPTQFSLIVKLFQHSGWSKEKKNTAKNRLDSTPYWLPEVMNWKTVYLHTQSQITNLALFDTFNLKDSHFYPFEILHSDTYLDIGNRHSLQSKFDIIRGERWAKNGNFSYPNAIISNFFDSSLSQIFQLQRNFSN